jgi:hypothetical protein
LSWYYFVANSFSLYLGWVTCASIISLGIVLKRTNGYSDLDVDIFAATFLAPLIAKYYCDFKDMKGYGYSNFGFLIGSLWAISGSITTLA